MISRRKFVASLGAGALMASGAQAELYCEPVDWMGTEYCTAGIQSINVRSAQQECQNWCWAACLQGIFATHGYYVDQSAIVERLYGNPSACLTATGMQITSTANGLWRAGNQTFRVNAVPLLDLHMGYWNPQAAAMAASELAMNRPIVNGALGHATIITAMSYYRDRFGQGMVTDVTIRDPWPGSVHRRKLRQDEAAGTFFMLAVHIG